MASLLRTLILTNANSVIIEQINLKGDFGESFNGGCVGLSLTNQVQEEEDFSMKL